jgi:hypothetical protein
MNPGAASPSPFPQPRESARAYLFEMIEQLARLARGNGDVEVAIYLKAILDAERVAERKRSA